MDKLAIEQSQQLAHEAECARLRAQDYAFWTQANSRDACRAAVYAARNAAGLTPAPRAPEYPVEPLQLWPGKGPTPACSPDEWDDV